MWTQVTVCLSLALQIVAIVSEDFCGVSGQDSIIQAFVATFDASTGILFSIAAFQFFFEREPWEALKMPRWRLLHSKLEDTHKQIRISFRESPWHLTRKADRIGRLYRPSTVSLSLFHLTAHFVFNLQLTNHWHQATELAKTGKSWTELPFANNLSMFIVPFLKEDMLPESAMPQQLVLNRDVLWLAAASSLSRLTSFVTASALFLLLRIIVHAIRSSNRSLSVVISLFEILRAFTVTAQEISIFTYSCAYKGIRTWAWPAESPDPDFRIQPWTKQQRIEFENLVWQQLHLFNPTRGLFWLLTRFKEEGAPRIFSAWATPLEKDFKEEFSWEMLLEVHDSNLQAGSETLVRKVHLKNVPMEVFRARNLHLYAQPRERYLGLLYICSSVCNIFLPAMFLAFHPHEPVKVYYMLEQVCAKVLRYYDPVDLSVNVLLKPVL